MQRLKAKHDPFMLAAMPSASGTTVTLDPETGNMIQAHVQLGDPNGMHPVGSRPITAYLSDTPQGAVCAAAPSGGWTNGTNGVISNLLIGKCAMFWSTVDGKVDIQVNETAVKTFYLILVFPNGEITSTKLAFA